MGPLENDGKIRQPKNRGFCNVSKKLTILEKTVFQKKPPEKFWKIIPKISPSKLFFGEFARQNLFFWQLRASESKFQEIPKFLFRLNQKTHQITEIMEPALRNLQKI